MPGTTDPVRYWLDSNIFITAARTYYAMDICPGFWEFLARESRIVSIEAVEREITRGGDALAIWIAAMPQPVQFYPLNDVEVIQSYSVLQNWANQQTQYLPRAKIEFAQADNADPWLVAAALAYGGIVVTHEKPDNQIKRKIPIPNVCKAFGIDWCDTWQLIRDFKVRFVLSS